MIGIVILMIMGRLQENIDTAPAYYWALAYAVISALLSLGSFAIGAIVIMMISNGLMAWAYFALLRRFGDSVALWWLIFLFFPLILFLLSL